MNAASRGAGMVLAALWLGACSASGNQSQLRAYGTVEARQVRVASRIGGRVLRVLVEENDEVTPGQKLVEIDVRELEATRDQARAALAQANARERLLVRGARREDVVEAQKALAAAEVRAEQARRELRRAEDLRAGEAIAQSSYDAARTAAGPRFRAHAARPVPEGGHRLPLSAPLDARAPAVALHPGPGALLRLRASQRGPEGRWPGRRLAATGRTRRLRRLDAGHGGVARAPGAAVSRGGAGIALRGLVRKELRQIRADRRMIPVLVIAPVLQFFIFGYAATMDVTRARVAMVDRDGSPASRALAARIRASDSFELAGYAATADDAEARLLGGSADMAVHVPAGHGRELAAGRGAEVQVVVDGTESTTATIGIAGAAGLLGSLAAQGAGGRIDDAGPAGVEVRRLVLYNPDFRSRLFMVPGMLAIVLLIVTLIATAMAVVKEKELGTFEMLAVTPVMRSTLLAGKLLPFAVFGLLDSVLVLLLSRYWFEVPMRGSVLLLLGAAFPWVLCTLGLGLLVSTVSRTQQQAMMTALFLVMLPLIYFSGFVFPIESMPVLVQPFTEADPLKHLMLVLRGVMLRGAGLAELWPPIAKLAVIGAITFGAAVAMFRKRLA